MNFHPSFRYSIAPMMDWTDRHCRYFHRLLTKNARGYTEMVTTGALLHGDVKRHLEFNMEELPLALQLGGSNPADLAKCAKLGEEWGYDEINLNCGCPSDRVQNGSFGACLMATPQLVAECVTSMKAAVKIPVTVKCRIGIDEQDEEESLFTFAAAMEQAGVDALIVHARKAWLKGLSPKENRDIPPLNYELVKRLKAKYPTMPIAINGGIASNEAGLALLNPIDGVMIGRAAYQEPYQLLDVDELFFNAEKPTESLQQRCDNALEALIPYAERELAKGARLSNITRHILGLYSGVPGARVYRRLLSTEAPKAGANASLLKEALAVLKAERAKAPPPLPSPANAEEGFSNVSAPSHIYGGG